MRSIWSGAISFGLINIPVKLYPAVEEHALDFDMLRRQDLCPIRYARVCRDTGEEVPYDDIVKGYEYRKGDYVVLEDTDFKAAAAGKSQTIDINEFVDASGSTRSSSRSRTTWSRRNRRGTPTACCGRR